MNEESPFMGRARTCRRVAFALGITALLVVAGRLATQLAPQAELVPVPMRALEIPPDLRLAAALPAEPGALAGRNLLLITLDTTRPDRIGIYGNDAIETPHLDRLAREGVIFSNAVAVAPTTLPTHASILTGLYPLHHGARANSSFVLAANQYTLAERLSDAGYATAAFVSAFVLDRRFGLSQGFDVYDDRIASPVDSVAVAERRADKTTNRALRWLRRARSRPTFTWVHYYDAHAYWNPPAPYSEQYPLTYDGEIAFVDAQVGRLIQAVRRGSRETVVVVVGDHGEALGEHGEGTHGVLVQEATLQIPLILHAPGGLEGGVHVPTRVSQIDLMPTLLSLLGRPVPLDLDGVDLALAPDPERAIYAENLEARLQYGWARLAALYRGSLKFVDGPSPELYDLGVDPLEHDDVAAARGAEIAALRDRMRALQALADDRLQPSTALEPADVRRLRALGYVVGAGHVVQASGPGPDPGEWLPLLGQLQALLSISRTPLPAWATLLGRLSGRPMPSGDVELTAAYEAIAERYPDFAPVYSYLIDLYKAAGRGRDADRAQERLTQVVLAASAGS